MKVQNTEDKAFPEKPRSAVGKSYLRNEALPKVFIISLSPEKPRSAVGRKQPEDPGASKGIKPHGAR